MKRPADRRRAGGRGERREEDITQTATTLLHTILKLRKGAYFYGRDVASTRIQNTQCAGMQTIENEGAEDDHRPAQEKEIERREECARNHGGWSSEARGTSIVVEKLGQPANKSAPDNVPVQEHTRTLALFIHPLRPL